MKLAILRCHANPKTDNFSRVLKLSPHKWGKKDLSSGTTLQASIKKLFTFQMALVYSCSIRNAAIVVSEGKKEKLRHETSGTYLF